MGPEIGGMSAVEAKKDDGEGPVMPEGMLEWSDTLRDIEWNNLQTDAPCNTKWNGRYRME